MIIGYSVEGPTDRAFLLGLRDRWCPHAQAVQGAVRGRSKLSIQREYAKMCSELAYKGADLIVILTDGNGRAWRRVRQEEIDRLPPERRELVIMGVPDRNIECWLCADADWIARRLGGLPSDYGGAPDPKGPFQRAMGISRDDTKGPEIGALVGEAPLARWIELCPSFAAFYAEIHRFSLRHGCTIENLREN